MTTGTGFCDVILPAMLADLGPLCVRVGAVVQLYIKRDHEDLARVVVLDAVPSVSPGEDPDADLFLAIDESALAGVLLGTLDVAAAVGSGQIEAEGDLSVLARLAALLDGARGPLATRLERAP